MKRPVNFVISVDEWNEMLDRVLKAEARVRRLENHIQIFADEFQERGLPELAEQANGLLAERLS